MRSIQAQDIRSILKKYMLADGYDFILDLEKSKGEYLHNKLTGKNYIDFFSFYASAPIGMNHPDLDDSNFTRRLLQTAKCKPSCSDIYTEELAIFVEAFSRIAMPEKFIHLFLIEGGASAVENALKVAFDWKVKINKKKGIRTEKGHQIIHFREAFHGRSGYTLSLTNTDPVKTAYFPKFDWPRILNPKIVYPLNSNLDAIIKSEHQAILAIKEAITKNRDDIAAIIIEPIQCEGGDNFFRKEFFIKIRQIADECEILLIFDEVQTGFGITGKFWAEEYYVTPDIIAFGKKAQVCGIISTDRIDNIEDNCFHKSGRINSTWGGNLTDMVRSAKYLEIIEDKNLVNNAEEMGKLLLSLIHNLSEEYPGLVMNPRGIGLLCSFDLPNSELRTALRKKCFDLGLIILGCGEKTIRFRTTLDITESALIEGFEIIKKALYLVVK